MLEEYRFAQAKRCSVYARATKRPEDIPRYFLSDVLVWRSASWSIDSDHSVCACALSTGGWLRSTGPTRLPMSLRTYASRPPS